MFTTWLATQVEALLTSLGEYASICLLIIILPFSFLLTYALSSYKFHHTVSAAKLYALHQSDRASETPTLPYWIPLLGHTFSFVFSTSRFMSHLSKTYPGLPIKLYVGGRLLQFIPHGDPVSTLHRHPRKLTNVLIPVKFMTDTGLSRDDQIRGEIDELSGVLSQPNPGWEHLPDHRRWNYLEHKDFAAHLSGSAQEAVLGKKFAERLTHELLSWASEQQQQQQQCSQPLDDRCSGGPWIEVPDLTKLLREKIFIAAVSALYGPELLEIAPELPKTYWAWLDQMPQMFRRLPKWMIPSAYAARERTLQILMKWDEIKRNEKPGVLERAKQGIWEWDSLHGSTLTQARTKMFDEFGISKEGAALFHSAMMFALTPNATYATIWSLLDVLRAGPGLISRVMAESAPYFQTPPDSDSPLPIPNTTEINRLPLLGSIFMETLRLRAASPVGRTPIDDSFHLYSPFLESNDNLKGWDKINGPQPELKWKLEKGVHIISSSWLGGHDATFWNEGHCSPETGKPEHPVDEFWAERFLEYPDDLLSGPVKKTSHNSRNTFQATYKKKTPEDDKTARLVTQGTSSHWFPFGGGLNTCPGRHFAKKEVTVAVAIFLRLFEFEGLEADGVDVNMDHYPFGTLPPKGKASVRMKLREEFGTSEK